MTRHKKWLKRSLLLLAIVCMLMIASGLILLYLYRATPSWYGHPRSTPQQAKDAANRADQKLLEVFSWAASVQAQWIRQSKDGPSSEPAVGPQTVTFDEDEINSFLRAWENPDKSILERKLSGQFSDARLVLEDGQIILAGQSSELGTIVSAEFTPSIDAQGRLRLSLDGLTAGRLPMPMSVVAQPLARLQHLLEELLAEYQESANIDPTLTANGPAIAAGWTRLMLNSLTDQPSDPIVFVPFDLGDLHRALPVKLTEINLAGGSITVTLEALGPHEREAVLRYLKEPTSQPAPSAP